jgi:hypothetical protein
VKVDLPGVGSNLADHPGAGVDPGFRSGSADPHFFYLAPFRTSFASPDEPPDVGVRSCDPFGDPAETSIEAVLLTPRSRGSVRLRSADPRALPRVSLPGLRDSEDVLRLLGLPCHRSDRCRRVRHPDRTLGFPTPGLDDDGRADHRKASRRSSRRGALTARWRRSVPTAWL